METSKPIESMPTEEEWWSSKFVLGKSPTTNNNNNQSRVRKNNVGTTSSFMTPGSSASIISQVTFPTRQFSGGTGQDRNHMYSKMAIVCGPRVFIYGSKPGSSLARSLDRYHKGKHEDGQEDLIEPDENVKPDHALQTGGFPAHSAAYHSDDRLLVVGCDEGIIKVFDSVNRITLRTMGGKALKSAVNSGHPIRSVGWLPNVMMPTTTPYGTPIVGAKKKILWSAGDDAIARIWDLGSGGANKGISGIGGIGDDSKPIFEFRGHGDSIRSCATFSMMEQPIAAAKADTRKRKKQGPTRRNFFVTGSYDHTIRVWDMDGLLGNLHVQGTFSRCISVMNHGAPVEAVLVISDDKQIPIIISAGGTMIKLWNPFLGKCVSKIDTKHSKTITSICMTRILYAETEDETNDNTFNHVYKHRLLSGGLDGLIRIYSLDSLYSDDLNATKMTLDKQNYDVPYLHGVKIGQPLSALSMNISGTRLVMGTTTGLVTVRKRCRHISKEKKEIKPTNPPAGTDAFFFRGAGTSADADDHVLQHKRKNALSKYDYFLKKFKYGEALDQALASGQSFAVTAVLEELAKRDGLFRAISNRDEDTLEPLLAFIARFINNSNYTAMLTGIANIVIDIYADIIGQSDSIDGLFQKLLDNVQKECKKEQALLELIGQIDAAMYSAEMDTMNG